MKISFLSVFPPYRGGISKHSSLIYSHLFKYHDIQSLNFKKLYPSIFFPGKSQYDSTLDPIGERILSSTNFFSWNKTSKEIISYSPDIFIFKFWHPFFVPCYNHIIKKIKKETNVKVIMICDNIIPHEKFPFSKKIIKKLMTKVDGFIVQSSIVEDQLKTLVKNPVYSKVFHPIYDTYPPERNKENSKKKMGISNSKVVLFFGFIRQYKGLDILIKSMEKIFEKDNEIKLLIAGECYEDKNRYDRIIAKSRHKDKIEWVERFIPDDEIPDYFSVSDVVVLPYKSASQSGIIPLSYHYDRPVITSNLKSLTEVIEEGKTGFVFELNDINSLTSKITDFFKDYNSDFYQKNIRSYKKNFSWKNFVTSIEDIYERI